MSISEVKINGIVLNDINNDTEALLDWWIKDSVDKKGIQEKYATLVFNKSKYIEIIGNLNTGYTCTIKRGPITGIEFTYLDGNITNINEDGDTLVITARTRWWQLTKKEMTYSYDANIDDEAGELSAIWEDVVTNYGGITSSAVSSGTGATEIRKKWPISNEKLSDVTDEIVELLGWVQYYNDNTQTAYLEPLGTTEFTTDLTVGDNIVNNLAWKNDYEAAVNIVKVTGAVRRDWNVQKFSGDGSTTDFTLTYIPKDTEIYIGSTLQTRGIEGAAESFDYEVDEQNKKIIFTTAPATGTDNIIINYSRDVPQAVLARSQDSIDQLGFESQGTYPIEDLRDIEDIKIKANSILNGLAFGFVSVDLLLYEVNGLTAGQLVHIIDPINSKDEYLTVKNATYRMSGNDSISCGNKRYKTTQLLNDFKTRIKKLEKSQITTDEFLQHLFLSERSFTFERRYSKLQLKNIAGATGIYGHPTFGVYGTAKYGNVDSGGFVLGHSTFGILGTSTLGSGAISPVTTKIVQGENTYKEFLYDDDFEDSSNTTATWDTTNKEISFTAGQIAQTSQIALGYAFDYFTISLGAVTGTLTTEISGDNGTTWQAVTLTTRTAFTSSDDTGILLRITESGASTAKIENTYKTSGEYDTPAIKVKLE